MGGSVGQLLGWGSSEVLPSSGMEIIAKFPADLSGVNTLSISAPALMLHNRGPTGSAGFLGEVHVDVPPFDVIAWSNPRNIYHRCDLRQQDLSILRVRVSDENGNDVDFRGSTWSFTLELEFEFDRNAEPQTDLASAVNGSAVRVDVSKK